MSGAIYFLRSCERACADIPLVPGAGARLGRGPLTGITDTRVSRLQAEVTVSGGGEVTITQRGPNHSVVSGKELRRGESVSLSPGKALNVLALFKFVGSGKLYIFLKVILLSFWRACTSSSFWRTTSVKLIKMKRKRRQIQRLQI